MYMVKRALCNAIISNSNVDGGIRYVLRLEDGIYTE